MFSGEFSNSVQMSLSSREMEIIELVADGLTNQEIAQKLTISKRTVDNHVSNMFTKTGSKNRVALLNWAMDHGKICRDGFNCCTLPDSSASASDSWLKSLLALAKPLMSIQLIEDRIIRHRQGKPHDLCTQIEEFHLGHTSQTKLAFLQSWLPGQASETSWEYEQNLNYKENIKIAPLPSWVDSIGWKYLFRPISNRVLG